MKAWKLISGILTIVFFLIVMLQSCAAGVVNALEDNGGTSGSIGLFVGILMLCGGIVSICVRKGGRGGNIALIVIFLLAAIIGFAGYGNYSDLVIWSIWCLINAILAVVALVKDK